MSKRLSKEDRQELRKAYDMVFHAVLFAKESQIELDKVLAKHKMTGDFLFESAWNDSGIGFHEALKKDLPK